MTMLEAVKAIQRAVEGYVPTKPCPVCDDFRNLNKLITAAESAAKAEAEAMDTIRAEVASLRAATGWRSMESAPKDATVILGVADGEDFVRLMAWTKTSHVPLYGWCLVDQGVEDCDICEPTHWMPLPVAQEANDA
jgi:hypothetical protein